MYVEIGKIFDIDGLQIFQMQSRDSADNIYDEQQERDQYYDRYQENGARNMGYKADYENYGDEMYQYNFESDNNMNFMSTRMTNYQQLR